MNRVKRNKLLFEFVILIYWFAYAITPIGKRNDESMWTKRVKPSVPRILRASFVIRNMF